MFSKNILIIKLGGSLILSKDKINSEFLKRFNYFIRKQIVDNNRRFFIVTGGGSTARNYIDAGSAVANRIEDEDLDWLGVHVTRLNAHLLRTIFKNIAHPRIIHEYDRLEPDIIKPIVIGAGWKPGWSANYYSMLLAKLYRPFPSLGKKMETIFLLEMQ